MIERTYRKHWPLPPPTNAERIASWLALYRLFRPTEPSLNNAGPVRQRNS